MKLIKNQTTVITSAMTVMLGLGVIGLASCSSGDDSTATPTTGGSAALQGPIAFVNNRGIGNQNTLSVIGIDDQGNLKIVSTMGTAGEFENNALGDMQFSSGEWVFVNLGAGGKVATIDPLSGATPIHEANLPTGERPVHIYRDPTNGEVIWSMNDANATTGLDSTNCSSQGGGSVSVLHNSHLGQGGNPPKVLGTTCLLAAGHKVAAFSQPTVANPAIPRLTFVSSATAGEISVLDNVESSANYRKLIGRVDLCTDAGEAAQVPPQPICNDEGATPLTTAFTPNKANPHGIRFSKLTGKIYSIQENYLEIVEIDPTLVVTGAPGNNQPAIVRRLNLAATPYTSFGITPNGKFLFLRGQDIATDPDHIIGKLAVVDLTASGPLAITALPDVLDVVPSTFKFTPDGQRMYLLASDTATGTGNQLLNQKKNRLFVFNPSAFPVVQAPVEITLQPASGHNFDVVVEGSGQASGVLVSNGTAGLNGLVSFIDANNQLIRNLVVGLNPGAVMIYAPGAAAAGNQASS